MAQAFDREGGRLGPEELAESMQEAFDKVFLKHPDANEIRVRKMLPAVMEGGELREAIASELRKGKEKLLDGMMAEVGEGEGD